MSIITQKLVNCKPPWLVFGTKSDGKYSEPLEAFFLTLENIENKHRKCCGDLLEFGTQSKSDLDFGGDGVNRMTGGVRFSVSSLI